MQQRCGIYIGNVDRSVTLEQLKVVFGPCGTILDSSMNGSAENAYRFAFMDFGSEEERQHALRLNGINLANRDLKVAPSKGVNQPGNNAHNGERGPPRHNNYQQPGMGGPQYGGYPPQQYGGYPPQGGYPMQPPPQQPSPQVIQQIIASMQAAGQLRPGQEPTQQQLQAIATAAIAVQQPQLQQPHMMMGGGGYPGGAYPHPQQQQPMMQMRAPQHTPANPPPTMEELALRAKQREQYLGKLRSEGERYETKIKKLLARGRGEAGGSGSDASSSDSSSESDDDIPKKKDDQNNNVDSNGAVVDHFNEKAVVEQQVVGEKRPREEEGTTSEEVKHT